MRLVQSAIHQLLFSASLLFFLTKCNSDQATHPQPLRIYAAASLTTVLAEIETEFTGIEPHVKLEFNFASSSFLAKQIEHGAPADIFLSADVEWMEYLLKRNLMTPDPRSVFLSNQLVLIVPIDNSRDIHGLPDLLDAKVERIALGDWAHVPAGKYARRALEEFGIWDEVAPKCLPAMDVRAALSYVEQGNADCGIVYRTDAAISHKISIASQLPVDIQPDIQYALGKTKSSTHPAASDFLEFLRSKTARRTFEKHGFTVFADE
jgi:molybdate transport system substrate-binding protein